jgi:hypothetical protein
MSKLSSPAVLGMSSSKEESISPTLPLTKQSEIKKETIKPTNTRVYIWALILFLTIGGIVYLFRRKYR